MADNEIKNKKNFRKVISKGLIFIAALAVMVYFLPREGKFRYHFNEGKPWKYGLMTAPFDFPVYKNEHDLDKERDSVMLKFQPYFIFNKQTGPQQIAALKMD